MESQDLTTFSNVLSVLLTAVVSIAGAWFVFKGKKTEAGASVDVAKINNEDDVIGAYGSLQTQLAQAAENLVAPLNLQIKELQSRLGLANEETKQLRDYVKQKSSELETISKRVAVLEEENAVLRGRLEKALRAETRMREKLDRIRKDIDTGNLDTGVHKLGE